MKRIFSALLIICLLLTACASAKSTTDTTAPQEETAVLTVPETEAETEAPLDTEEGTLFSEILFCYSQALAEGWDMDQYRSAGMSYLAAFINDPDKLGYCLMDLEDDGYPELLIGAVGEPQIYAMYAHTSEADFIVIDAGERNTFRLMGNGKFLNFGSNSAASSGYRFLRYENSDLVFEDAIVFDSDISPNAPWFYAVDDDWDVTNDTPLSEEEADASIAAAEDSVVAIPYIPFSEFSAG